jgi:tyrosyl-tRNA synthetase
VLTTPLLLSWDGEKMSSSVGNNVPLTAAPEEMFGRTMRIPDSMLEEWYRLVAERPVPEGDPMSAKLELARFIVARSHGEDAAREAEEHFTRVVRQGEAPEDVPEATFEASDGGIVYLPGLLAGLAGNSSSHWRRQIDQGGVRVNGRSVTGYELDAATLDGALLQAGKRQFFRLRPA